MIAQILSILFCGLSVILNINPNVVPKLFNCPICNLATSPLDLKIDLITA